MTALVWLGALLAGGAGSVARFLVDRAVSRRTASRFPAGTLVVNLSGAAALGALSGLAVTGTDWLLAGTAAVGSYTTFSTWMFESQRSAEEHAFGVAWLNVVGSALLGLGALAAGRWLGTP